MGKSPEEKIREKLVELELSIKDEESQKLPVAGQSRSKSLQPVGSGTQMAPVSADDAAGDLQLYKYGGLALCGVGLALVLGHAGISSSWMMMWGRGPSVGVLLLPLLAGVGMMIYNYKSKLAQAIVAGSLVLFILALFSSLVITFPQMTILDFIFMTAPVCAGLALLAKGYKKSQELKGLTKESK